MLTSGQFNTNVFSLDKFVGQNINYTHLVSSVNNSLAFTRAHNSELEKFLNKSIL